jgi:Arm DNA-binding domain
MDYAGIESSAVLRDLLTSEEFVGLCVGPEAKSHRSRPTNVAHRRHNSNAQAIAEKTIKLSDGGGLQVWVTSSGSKLWYLAYRFAGKQRKLAVGPYPRIGLKEARQRRDDAKRQIEGGVDPSLQKRLDRLSAASEQATTFGVIAFELLDKKRREAKADRTISKLEWLFSLATPSLGQRPIAGITAPEILQVLRAVETRGKLETAKRLRAVIGEVAMRSRPGGRKSIQPPPCVAH